MLYLDCFSGISGDMFIGALLDAGADSNYLKKELNKLNLAEEYTIQIRKINKNGIVATKFDVLIKNESWKNSNSIEDSHEHSHEDGHEHSHEHSHEDGHEHSHEDGHEHSHEHSHEDGHEHSHEHSHEDSHEHNYTYRSYKEIQNIISISSLPNSVKERAIDIFKKVGEAEGKIHGLPLEKVHFHEVGAIDSIIDIVGAAILLDSMQITKVVSSPIPVGAGKIRIAHGLYPVPAPATLEILKGIPVCVSSIKTELTTPTGAAIASIITEEFGLMPSLKPQYVGYGAGTKDFKDIPNVLRVVIGESIL